MEVRQKAHGKKNHQEESLVVQTFLRSVHTFNVAFLFTLTLNSLPCIKTEVKHKTKMEMMGKHQHELGHMARENEGQQLQR